MHEDSKKHSTATDGKPHVSSSSLSDWRNDEYDENSQPPKMTKDEFIKKTRLMLQAIMDGYICNWKDKFDEDDESEENTCSRCNGFLYIEQGGVGDVDCPSCNGTGRNNERVFDTENFVEFIKHGVIFGEQPFLYLLHCEIVDTEQDGSACV